MKNHIYKALFALAMLAAITQTASAKVPDVPEVAATSALMAIAVGGLAFLRKYFR